jgi:hypothetical protein
MDRPSPSPGSTAGHSLVGTLIAFGLLLGMIMLGLSLAAATEARYIPSAKLSGDALEARRCPANVLEDAPNASKRTCMTLTVHNDGDAAGTATCRIIDEPANAEARFENGFSVYSIEIPAGSVDPLLIRVDGGGKNATAGVATTCDLVPPRAT